ncbi:hypothetical protein ACLBKU_08855 [Erythrobacter sp. NE805]|uniref:hypothetical protein n=1 Tax=Erythrobacter sp. NE805 TaxID=3389875 RepID=UPI00396B29C2
MSTPSPTDQRDALRARIEAAERRNAERTLADQAREAAGAAADYTRAHPLTVIGGAVALGLAIGLLTRPGRRVARQAGEAISGAASSASAGVKQATTRGRSRIGAMIGDAAFSYLMAAVEELLETARAGQDKAAELGDATGTQAKRLSAGASEAADSTRALARKTADVAVGVVRDLRRKTKV